VGARGILTYAPPGGDLPVAGCRSPVLYFVCREASRLPQQTSLAPPRIPPLDGAWAAPRPALHVGSFLPPSGRRIGF